jgi:hypothetical protein
MTDDDIRLAAALAAAEDAPKDVLDELPPAGEFPADPEKEQMRQRLDELEPFVPMIGALGRRELILQEAPPPGPTITEPEEVVKYHRNLSQPGADAIRKQVQAWADTLPEDMKSALDSNYAEFNRAFERFAEANKESTPAPGPPTTSREIIEKILEARESRKDAARTLRAGVVTGSEAFGGEDRVATKREKQMEALKLKIRRDPTNTDLQQRLARFYLED